MTAKLRRFAQLDCQQKIILTQAWFMLGWFRAAILLVSFKGLASALQHHREPPQAIDISNDKLEQAASIGKLVAAAAKITPWQSKCLVQVIVAQRLLARRGIAGQYYLGVRKGGETSSDSAELSAHAWLQCGPLIVNGAAGHEAFAVVSTFSWPGAS